MSGNGWAAGRRFLSLRSMIEVDQLVKRYGPTVAVDRLSFKIDAGQVVGFLGPNGAGKTTTLRILTGYLPPTSGLATVAGVDVSTASLEVRSKIGYLPENTPLYPEMRVEEYLHYRGKLFDMDRATRRKRIDLVCDRCGLSGVRGRVIGHLSKGNRQRVGLAQALLHDPAVLILDEPTAGMDPNQITHVRELLAELRGKHTILLSTHILPEVEKSADRVLIIAGGRIVANGTPAELRRGASTGSRVLAEVKATPEEVVEVLGSVHDVAGVETAAVDGWCQAVVSAREGRDIRETVCAALTARRWPVREIRHETATLEQFFVQMTAQQAAAGPGIRG